jgi:hypothetical protein
VWLHAERVPGELIMNKSLLLASCLFAGCASEGDSQFIDGFAPPAPGSDEIQIVSPAVRAVQPGQDITLCAYIDERLASDTDIVSYKGYQSHVGGHHVILYAVERAQPANVHECNEDDMVNARYLAGTGADSPPAELPEGVVFRIPGNTQLMIQTHWINATDKAIDGQGAFNLKVTAPSPAHQLAQLFTTVTTSFTLPPGTGAASSECTVKEHMNVFMLGGHMHEWGTHVKIAHTPVAGASPNVIYDYGWSSEDVFDPPRNNYTTANPFILNVGDKIKIDCSYNNTTGSPLPFPTEMCAAFVYGYPLDKQIDCVDGNWPN